MSVPRIYIRDRNALRVAEVDDFGSLELVARDNALGAWTFDLPADSQYVPLLDPDTSDGIAGIVVTLDGTPIFSGPVIQRQESATVARFSGYCDLWMLARHVSIPAPGQDDLAVAGVASTAMRQFVDAQIGPNTIFPTRQVGVLTFPGDPAVGASVTTTIARYTPLLTAIQTLALQGGGLRFHIDQSTDWSPAYVEFVVEQRRDLRDSVLFSLAAGTLEDFSHTRQAASVNHVYAASGAGGDGTPASPVIAEFDAASIQKFGRIETFVTQPQTDDGTEVLAAATEALAEGADRRSVTLTPIETSDLQFGTHYGLGDLVRAIARYDGSLLVDAVIREVHVKIEAQNGVSVTPMLGTPGMSNDPITSQIISKLNDRVRVLERSSGSLGQVRNLDGAVTDLDSAITVLNTTTFIGEIKIWPGSSPPAANWLFCQGQAISRTTYAALYAVLGNQYGAGDGSTTFNVPNLQSRFLVGSTGESGGYPRGATGGSATVDVGHDHPHSHGGVTDAPNETEQLPTGVQNAGLVAADGHEHPIFSDDTAPTWDSGSSSKSIVPPYLAMHVMIRAS